MSLRFAAVCGIAAAIAVPVIVAKTGMVQSGLLVGRVFRVPVGGGIMLHWSWQIFCITTLAVWALLAATRDR